MTVTAILDSVYGMEAALWLLAILCFIRAKVRYELPALGIFFVIRVLSSAIYLACLQWGRLVPLPPGALYHIYYYTFWPLEVCGAVAAFVTIQQIIRSALAPLPGLSSLGVLFFRWAGLLSIVIAITAHLGDVQGVTVLHWFNKLLVSCALCMCLFEVSLLSLLGLTTRLLGLSFRSRVFGVSLGLALLGITEFFNLALTSNGGAVVSAVNTWCEFTTLGTLMMMIFYVVRPEPQRGRLAAEKASTLMRWNEIVREMGVGPPLPVEHIPNFMEDVEGLVERIMSANSVEGV